MWSFDLFPAFLLLAVAVSVGLAYAVRSVFSGRIKYDRVEKQGGSPLMGKGMMEVGYWGLQPVARALISLGLTPNALSWLSLLFGLAAGLCFPFGHFGFAAVFASVSALLDSLDGMVARLTGVASDAGEVLDAAIDRYVEFFFIGGLVIYYKDIPILQILALLALLGSFMVSYTTAKAEALQVSPPKGAMRRPERAFYLTLGAVLSPITIPIFEVYREYPVAIGHPMVAALCLVAVVANVSAIERFWAIAKAIRSREEALRLTQAAQARADLNKQEEATSTHPAGRFPSQ